jgi:predicted transcriptional regulator
METDKRELEVIGKKKELEKKKEIAEKMRITIEKISERWKKLIKELDVIKNTLLMHYHKLLAEGKDTRYNSF